MRFSSFVNWALVTVGGLSLILAEGAAGCTNDAEDCEERRLVCNPSELQTSSASSGGAGGSDASTSGSSGASGGGSTSASGSGERERERERGRERGREREHSGECDRRVRIAARPQAARAARVARGRVELGLGEVEARAARVARGELAVQAAGSPRAACRAN